MPNSPYWLSRFRSEYDDPWYESGVYGFRLAAALPPDDVTNLRAFDPAATRFEWDAMTDRSGAVYDLSRPRRDAGAGLAGWLKSVEIDREYRKKKEDLTPSDHAPVLADL